MTRVAAIVALSLLLATTVAAAAPRPTHLWYRTTIFGTYEETLSGGNPTGPSTIYEQEYVAWRLRSTAATTVSRRGGGLDVGARFGGRLSQYDLLRSTVNPLINTGALCTERAKFGYWDPGEAPLIGGLAGEIRGRVTKPQLTIAGSGEIEVSRTITHTCPSGSSTDTSPGRVPLSFLAPVLVPPQALFDQGLSSPSPIRFGRFFFVAGTFVDSKPLGELLVGVDGTWTRTWNIEIWFTPCPNLRC
jgi:hypothetical protein